MPLETTHSPCKFNFPLLDCLAMVLVVLHVGEWPLATCGTEVQVLHHAQRFEVEG